jgi:hypothetical protein
MRGITAFLLVSLTLAGPPVAANPIYKCRASDGKVTYSQMPCYGDQWHRLGERQETPRSAERARAAAAATTATSATSDRSAGAPAPAPETPKPAAEGAK